MSADTSHVVARAVQRSGGSLRRLRRLIRAGDPIVKSTPAPVVARPAPATATACGSAPTAAATDVARRSPGAGRRRGASSPPTSSAGAGACGVHRDALPGPSKERPGQITRRCRPSYGRRKEAVMAFKISKPTPGRRQVGQGRPPRPPAPVHRRRRSPPSRSTRRSATAAAVHVDHVVCVDDREVWADLLVFGAALVPRLDGCDADVVVGRLGQGLAKAGRSAPWTLDDPTDDDLDRRAVPRAYAALAVGQVVLDVKRSRDRDTTSRSDGGDASATTRRRGRRVRATSRRCAPSSTAGRGNDAA